MRTYRRLVIATLLTLVGSLAAQATPFVLRYTVDMVQDMLNLAQGWLLARVSGLLLGQEINCPSLARV